MLHPVQALPPETPDEVLARLFTHRNVVARCADSGAYLEKSRGQYTLVIEQPFTTRHWSRRTVTSDQDAIDRANRSLAKILSKRGMLSATGACPSADEEGEIG